MLGTGAASFKRMLGCAPKIVARPRPRALRVPRPRHRRSPLRSARVLGRMDRRSELTSSAGPNPPRDFALGSALGSNRTTPTDAGTGKEPTTWVFTKAFGLKWDAQPNMH